MNKQKTEDCKYCHGDYSEDESVFETRANAAWANGFKKVYWVGKGIPATPYPQNPDFKNIDRADAVQELQIIKTDQGYYLVFFSADENLLSYTKIKACPICRRDFDNEENN